MRFLPLIAAALLAAPARAQVRTESVGTDLGDAGNAYVAQNFEAYRAAHPDGACRAAGSGTRVLLTGFGLFYGAAYNVSGTTVRSMADPAFWPDRVDTKSPGAPLRAQPTPTAMTSADHGGEAYNRTLFIDGRRYEVCFLVLDVVWDLAASIIVHEESRFKPRLVMMTGRWADTLSVEAGALNKSDELQGYDSAGRPLDEVNVPVSPWLLPDYPAGAALAMTWDAKKLAQASAADAQALGYSAAGQTGARPDNDYLCNDVSFTALSASQNKPVSLAGGRVTLDSPELPAPPAVGFLHFPATDEDHPDLAAYGQGIYGWGRVVARIIGLAAPAAP